MNQVFDKDNSLDRGKIKEAIADFTHTGEVLVKGKRNVIKLFTINGQVINVKSFRMPNLINKIVYRFFRKSKARRSFEFAKRLLENNIGTPKPIAYFENYDAVGLTDSYYVCEHLYPDLTYRELVADPDYPEHEIILRQFTQFSFRLHEKGIEFKDHSPGNTLIVKRGEGIYDFYLVDLNRMEFHAAMSFDQRMENLKRLTPKKEMVAVMSNEYAKLYGRAEAEVFEKLWQKTTAFQEKFRRKKRLKSKLGIGKKK
ncbi:lipopolysaccharide kinase InaA family protein [Flavobacterium sp. MK4S-17]|uniref:lipopolysaccharide kinase InaA family protein n=1 Tax=Flavobacterium sp. MK4S-17 TaxID=2543737 RepID=UPI00135A22EB|nr:lipopolysaccharide kinase InaA family protein [Flavobacterium sp. MK4S-17]